MRRILKEHYPGFILLCIILMPEFNSIGVDLQPMRAEDFFVLLGFFAVLLFLPTSKSRMAGTRRIPALFCFLGAAGICGLSIGYIVLGEPSVFRDIMFLPQIAKYILIYWLFLRLMTSQQAEINLFKYICISSFACAIVGVAQYWNIFSINEWLTPLYFNEENDELSLSQMVYELMNFRVPGTIGNPNYYGYFLAWHAAWLIAYCMYSDKKNVKIICGGLLAIIAIAALLVQSRSTILIFAAMIIVVLSGRKSIRLRTKVSLIVMITVVVLMVINLVTSSSMSERTFGTRLHLNSPSTKISYEGRVRDLVVPIENALENPVILPFGQGPSKAVLRTDSHNGFTWILQRFGAVGLCLYLAILGVLLSNAKKANVRAVHWFTHFVALSVFLSCWVWLIADMTGNVFKEPRLMSLNMLSAGWLYAHLNRCFIESKEYLLAHKDSIILARKQRFKR